MISLPLFDRLVVEDYGLYPGTSRKPGIDVTFSPGLTLVLGANGLGKTTLVSLLYRMCSGPFDIPGLAGATELGTRSRDAKRISRPERRTFADRVADGAATATATLNLAIGSTKLQITRSLSDLALTSLLVDDQEVDPSEAMFQKTILRLAELPTFGDWILILRHLVFYFEDRRALVWDPSAQRQLFRLLFLPSDEAHEWSALEREVLQLDSRVRNLQAAVSREEASLTQTEEAAQQDSDLRAELKALQDVQEGDIEEFESLSSDFPKLEAARQKARLEALKAEANHESAYRELERQQLTRIDAAFPSSDATARYLLAHLISNNECLACGNNAPKAATELKRRLDEEQCVVCGSPVDVPDSSEEISTRSLSKAAAAVNRQAERLKSTSVEREAAEDAFEAMLTTIQELRTEIASRSAKIDALLNRLPPDEAELLRRRDELSNLRGRVEIMKRELGKKRSHFSSFISQINEEIVTHKDEVKRVFENFAEDFLLEVCALVWAPHGDRVGETGARIQFPNYELEVGGPDLSSPVRRSGPDQVSESQREFIDLAFRMTLMTVASEEHAGSLVIDAPESSLDAVFVSRAAKVLTRFANPSLENRLVVTSNLIEGDLIPQLARQSGIHTERDRRVIDLLRVAAPTMATRKLHREYVQVRRELFRRARGEQS